MFFTESFFIFFNDIEGFLGKGFLGATMGSRVFSELNQGFQNFDSKRKMETS
jgi:hypothetical protein